MDEKRLEQILKQDLSEGTGEFRDALLQRCLEVLGSDERVVDLDDASLEALAAAGDMSLLQGLLQGDESLLSSSLVDVDAAFSLRRRPFADDDVNNC